MWDRIKDFYKEHAGQAELLPVVFVIGILPLVVKQKDFMTNLQGFSWYSSDNFAIDVFNYYKRNIIIIAAVFMALLLLVDVLDGSLRIKGKARLILAAMGGYELLAVLSCVFSKYRWFGIHGTESHFETVYVLVSYGVFLLFTYHSIKKEDDVRLVLSSWGILLVPMILLGLSQAFGHDFYETDLGSRLVMTSASYEVGGRIQSILGKGRVYLSLYNPNYVGAFGAMIIPVMVTLCLNAKSIKLRLFYGFLSAGLLLCLLGASAKTGIAALTVAMAFLLILMRRQVMRRKRIVLVSAAVGMAVCVCYLIVSGDGLVQSVKSSLLDFSRNDMVYNLEGIETLQDGVEITYKGNKLLVRYAPVQDGVANKDSSTPSEGQGGFLVTDGKGNPVKLSPEESGTGFRVDDGRFEGIKLTPVMLQETLAFDLNIEGKSWYFSNQTIYEGYYYYSPYGKFATIHTAPHIGFEGYETIASGRGYIWSRTLPLLKKHMFLGSGPDSFLLAFPQNDYVVKARYGYEEQLISKPHNMYLQMGVQTGCVSLIAYLAVYVTYAAWSLKLYWKNSMEGWIPAMGAAVFTGTAAYMVVGLTADSTVNVAPVFWCLLGLGMAVNRIVVDENLSGETGK